MSDMVIGDDGWTEIVGEQTRGGGGPQNTLQPILGNAGFEILGELMERSPAFRQYAERRAAASRPMVHKVPLQKARDWQIDFGPVSGAAGSTTTITVAPQCLFRGEKVMATDTASPAGTGTRVSTILIGQKLQRPAGSGATLTAFFANNALGNGIKWDTCEKALSIAVTVSFISACTFDMTVFGKAVL